MEDSGLLAKKGNGDKQMLVVSKLEKEYINFTPKASCQKCYKEKIHTDPLPPT